MPRLDAASISRISTLVPFVIETHWSHVLQGSNPSSLFLAEVSQLTTFATILAVDVFPNPLGPVKRNAWGIFFCKTAWRVSRTDALSRSSIFCGRYFR